VPLAVYIHHRYLSNTPMRQLLPQLQYDEGVENVVNPADGEVENIEAQILELAAGQAGTESMYHHIGRNHMPKKCECNVE